MNSRPADGDHTQKGRLGVSARSDKSKEQIQDKILQKIKTNFKGTVLKHTISHGGVIIMPANQKKIIHDRRPDGSEVANGEKTTLSE